jgi:hypothetical protein
MQTKLAGWLLLGLLTGPIAAQAAYLVDTGPAQAGTIELSLASLGVSYQYLGATFNVPLGTSLTSVEGWINGSGSLRFELRQGATPNGALLFSSVVGVAAPASGWYGATGLDWDVPAGDYTLAVIAQPGFSGGMATAPPNPLGTEWFTNPLAPNWTATNFNMGWRVGAIDATVPEPGTLALRGLGLAGLGLGRRRTA